MKRAKAVLVAILALIVLPPIALQTADKLTGRAEEKPAAAQGAIPGTVRLERIGYEVGFRDFADWQKYAALKLQDFAAAERFWKSKRLGTEITVWKKGEQVFVAERAPYSVCLRKPADTACFWGSAGMIDEGQ